MSVSAIRRIFISSKFVLLPNRSSLLIAPYFCKLFFKIKHQPIHYNYHSFITITMSVEKSTNQISKTFKISQTRAKSAATSGKIAIVILGIVVLAVGIYSHFQSDWRKQKLYKICEYYDIIGLDVKCTAFSLELYFVSMIIICFILSLFNYAATLLLDDHQYETIKLVDFAYHILSAIALLIAAIVYFVSTEEIHYLLGNGKHAGEFLRTEKLIAGILTTLQACLYGAVGYFIIRY